MLKYLKDAIQQGAFNSLEQLGVTRPPGPTALDRQRMAYDLITQSDVTIPLPDAITQVVQQPPAYTVDPIIAERDYVEHVALVAGGAVTLGDLLKSPSANVMPSSTSGSSSSSASLTGGSGKKSSSGGGGGSKQSQYEQMAKAQQDVFNQALKAEQAAVSHLFSWVYDSAFAALDMVGFDKAMHTFDDVYRRHLFEVMTTRSRPSAYRALDRRSKRLVMVEEAIGGGSGQERELTLAEMRALINKQLASKEYVPATITFGEAPGEKEKKEALREQETQIDDGTHARRMEEAQFAAGLAAQGHAHGDDVRELAGDLFGMQLKRKPPPLPAPAGSSGAKKRPRAKSGGGGSKPKKKAKH
jgi:hypothetical protein